VVLAGGERRSPGKLGITPASTRHGAFSFRKGLFAQENLEHAHGRQSPYRSDVDGVPYREAALSSPAESGTRRGAPWLQDWRRIPKPSITDTMSKPLAPRLARPWLVLGACLSLGCQEPTIDSITGTRSEGAPAPSVTPTDSWTSISADVSVTREVIDGRTGSAVGQPVAVGYSLTETRVGSGWKAVFTLPPRDAGGIVALRRPARDRDLGRIEVDPSRQASYFRRDGSRMSEPRADLSQLRSTTAAGSRASSVFSGIPRSGATGVSPGAAERQSLLAGLVIDTSSRTVVRAGLIERYGSPTPSSENGTEAFRTTAGDTTRTLTFRSDLGAVTGVRVEVGGRLVSQLEYQISALGQGLIARTSVRTLQANPSRTGHDRLLATRVAWSNVRYAK
jgi:hypothetical protein